MNIKKNLLGMLGKIPGVKHTVISDLSEREAMIVAAAKRGNQGVSRDLNREVESQITKDLRDWQMALVMATDPKEPNRQALGELYRNLMLDNHLSSVIDSRILFCQRSPFKIVDGQGNENDELSWMFERTWFEEFIRLVLMSRFQGATLIEIFEINPDTRELAEIEEIPSAFFNTRRGIITKNPGETTGWNYRDGWLANYYIQVGKNRDIGMLSDMAPIVLAKKLGMGSWLDYIEKYGVPPLFITTDREDDARLEQLWEAARNFKSNAFMVGRGQEKFEIGNVGSGNPDNFDKLIIRANDEISKRVLGGSGLTDEKAYVGSSEIQFRLAKDRFESDKLLIKNVINQQLLPRLQRLSPVYQVLKNHYFEWDNTEAETRRDVQTMLTTLAPHFELDLEEVSQKTGFTILAQKSGAPILEEEATKKKSVNANA